MIDKQTLLSWRDNAPWVNAAQIEQDLIISRALIEIYSHPLLKNELVFRGGTALQKCFYNYPTRYSEDLDFVQIKQGPIGHIFDALRSILEPWLGKPNINLSSGRATQIYRFVSSGIEQQRMRLKIEINTSENYNILDLAEKLFVLKSNWYSGNAIIKTYQVDELMGTKLRALFQRKKGRDLFDMARAIELLPINIEKILLCFNSYLDREGAKISRAEFEKNLTMKKNIIMFKEDMSPLLADDAQHDFDKDFNLVMREIISKLPGEPWKSLA
jgi:predicted nucleotidyltransferase component of viral defense system